MRVKKDINTQIGANIQAAREAAHYTQEKLSELLGITPNHLSAIERGASGISLETLQKLCRLLPISADYILFGNASSDGEFSETVRLLNKIDPKYKPQVNQIILALLEMSAY